jgi:hypothetical protein
VVSYDKNIYVSPYSEAILRVYLGPDAQPMPGEVLRNRKDDAEVYIYDGDQLDPLAKSVDEVVAIIGAEGEASLSQERYQNDFNELSTLASILKVIKDRRTQQA